MAKDKDAADIVTVTELMTESFNRPVLTLCPSMDMALSGGIPFGSTVVISGKFGVAKTTMALQYAANAQRMFGSPVLLYPVEGRLTSTVLNQIQGMDRDAAKVVRPQEETEGIRKKWTAEQWWKELGKNILEFPGAVHIMDSVSVMITETELSEGVGYKSRGAKNQVEASFCRNFGDLIASTKSIVFLIAQVQANTSGYGLAELAKVGNAIKHQADAIIHAEYAEKWKEHEGRILGHTAHIRVDKSPLGPPNIKAEVPLRYGHGIDNLQDIFNHAVQMGLVTKAGSWYVMPFETQENGEFVFNPSPSKDGAAKFQGELRARNFLFTNNNCASVLEAKVRATLFNIPSV